MFSPILMFVYCYFFSPISWEPFWTGTSVTKASWLRASTPDYPGPPFLRATLVYPAPPQPRANLAASQVHHPYTRHLTILSALVNSKMKIRRIDLIMFDISASRESFGYVIVIKITKEYCMTFIEYLKEDQQLDLDKPCSFIYFANNALVRKIARK